MPRLPQPGEHWRIRIHPVEFRCPRCGVPIHVQRNAANGKIVQIVERSSDDTFGRRNVAFHDHAKSGCGGSFTVPDGWVWFFDGWSGVYTLPYTMFEPIQPEDHREMQQS